MAVDDHAHGQRRGTASAWNSANPTLRAGELGVESDTGLIKLGDGSTQWTDLDYINGIEPIQAELNSTYLQGKAAFQPAMRKLTANVEDVTFTFLGDSTWNNTTEPVYLTAQALAAAWPTHTVKYYTTTDGTSWSAATTLQTGSGAQTLHIYNGAVAGKNIYFWQAPNFDVLVTDQNPDLVLVATGHNEGQFTTDPLSLGQPAEAFRLRAWSIVDQIRTAVPEAQVVLVSQNPWQDGTGDMGAKRDQLRLVAETCGCGFIDLYAAWQDAPVDASYYADNIHPTGPGNTLGATVLTSAFTYDPKWEPRPAPAVITGPDVDLGGDLTIPVGATAVPGWTADNVTVSRDTSNFETARGYAVRTLSTNGANPSRLYRTVLDSNQIVPYRGKWLTLGVRVRRTAAGGVDNRFVGRLAVTDGVNASKTFGDDSSEGDFTWRLLPHKVADAATTLLVSLWCDNLGGASDPDVTWDQFFVVPGRWPHPGAMEHIDALRQPVKFEQVTVGASDQTGRVDLTIDGAAGVNRTLAWLTAGVNRWLVRPFNTESGSDVGSDLMFFARNDAGASIGTAMTIRRKRLNVEFGSWITPGKYTTAGRPSASTAGSGAVIYDTDLAKLILSNGSTWTNVDGTSL